MKEVRWGYKLQNNIYIKIQKRGCKLFGLILIFPIINILNYTI